jgi:hypothetical protein
MQISITLPGMGLVSLGGTQHVRVSSLLVNYAKPVIRPTASSITTTLETIKRPNRALQSGVQKRRRMGVASIPRVSRDAVARMPRTFAVDWPPAMTGAVDEHRKYFRILARSS